MRNGRAMTLRYNKRGIDALLDLDFHFSATARVCALDSCLVRLGKPFIHFVLVGEQLLDARALYPSGVIVGRPVSSTF